MGDASTTFFRGLARGGHEPLLRRATGTIRFDLDTGGTTRQWLVRIAGGELSVARRGGGADCVVATDAALFDRLVTGEENMLAMILRGRVTVTQDQPELLVLFQRFLRSRIAVGAGGAR